MPGRTLLLIFAARLLCHGQQCEPLPQYAHQDSLRDGPVYKQQVIDEYAGLLAKHPADPVYLFLHARVLIGTKTALAIEEFNQSLQSDPSLALAHLALVPIYQSPNFKNAAQAQTHLEAWMNACPSQFDGFHLLQHMPESEFKKTSVARLRTLIEARSDDKAFAHYRTLWTLEYEVHPATEYAKVKERI